MGLLNKDSEEAVEAPSLITVLDRVEHIDATRSFEEHVDYFRNAISSNRKRTLKTIWEIGSFISLLKDEKTYGGKTVESFVNRMDDISISTKEAYKWAQFAERYSAERVNALLSKNNIGWGVVSNLIRIKDDEIRLSLEERLHTGEIPASKIQDVVSGVNKMLAVDAAAPTEGANTPPLNGQDPNNTQEPKRNPCHASFKKLNNFLDNVLTMQEPCAKDINDLSAILDDEKLYERAVDAMELFRAKLPQAIKVLTELDSALDKTI